ncbi:aminopeptidase N [Kribbella flavida DSM 17836]|uniref:Aminopeptidase N n=1 Tax=Kribbella flavida (strain DSM 17836 / JCM 10339 / NBRC 14399) TaxID=479435 RepID=D2PKG7_KRIFD|nr:aminopeptidase N [Kribbella flavida]ADB30479.1 aminopeptidase N [Kribbella flavida DSM 17836]
MPALTVDEARARADAVEVRGYHLDFDFTTGDETFRAVSTVWFAATAEQTWLDVKPRELVSAVLNGVPLDVTGLDDGRLPLTGLRAENELVVDAVMEYAHDSEGLQRSVDADGRVYLYGMSSLESAPRYFACFDQPDLKAPYRMTATVPEGWIVLGNATATEVAPGRWQVAETKPLSTYFVTLVAGPYHLIRGEHDGIPLGLAARQSLAPYLEQDAEELFRVTGQAFDEYHRLFGRRYPFGEYHQVFVPDLNLGAMENPGCVTFADNFVFRSAVTDAERSTRARVMVHEMAHMWFGDLVTMRWWNDLWLNESFADYMAHRVSHDVLDHPGHWTDFGFVRKWWGLQADQRSSSHPVATEPGKDARAALEDFDGISYAKGAAVLKQLATYLGDEVFLRGINAHLGAHEYGNADLAEFVGKLTEAGATDLASWSDQWLRTSGLDTISAERTATGVVLRRSRPDQAERPHRLTVAGYDKTGRGPSVDVLLDVDELEVALDPSVAVVVPDAADDTWAKIRLDAASLEALPRVLPAIADGITRAVIWNSIRDAVADAELDPVQALDILLAALPQEDSDIAVGSLLRWAEDRLLGVALPYEPHRARLADALTARLGTCPPGSSLQLAIARGVIRTSNDEKLLRSWLDSGEGGQVPDGLVVDSELRWALILQLVRLTAFGAAEIDAELARDRSSEGAIQAARCRAALPAGKEAAWTRIMTDPAIGMSELYALCEGFWHPTQTELTAPYVARYFTDIRRTAEIRFGLTLGMTAGRMFPSLVVDPATVTLARQLAADESVAPGIRRGVADATDDLVRALAVRRSAG